MVAITRVNPYVKRELGHWDGVAAYATAISRSACGVTKTGEPVDYGVDIKEVYGKVTGATLATIQAAVTAVGSAVVAFQLTPEEWTIDDNYTVPSNVVLVLPPGCLVNVDSGKTLTINGPIITGHYQIFSGSGAIAGLARVSEKLTEWWGSAWDGITDDTASLAAAFALGGKFLLPPATTIFSTLTIPGDTTLIGCGKEKTIFSTATTGDAITLDGHRIHLQDVKITQSGSVQGNGIVANNKYWFSTERIIVDGFEYNLYISKSLYHSHKDSRFVNGDWGAYYWGASGSWNTDWYNNQNVFNNCQCNGNTNTGFYHKGVGLTAIAVDASSNTTGFHLLGEDSTKKANGSVLIAPYSESTDSIFKFDDIYANIVGGFAQGGAVGTPASAILTLDESRVIVDGLRTQDYWTNSWVLTNNSELFHQDPVNAAGATVSVDATSSAMDNTGQATDSYTGTLTGCTTSPTGTIKYTKIGNVITLSFAAINATSNSTAATITGMPSAIRPTTQKSVFLRTTDNGVNADATCTIQTDGTIVLYPDHSGGNFTASGTKGIDGCTATYLIA